MKSLTLFLALVVSIIADEPEKILPPSQKITTEVSTLGTDSTASGAEQVKAISGTRWALADSKGNYCDLRFEADGSLIVRKLITYSKRDPANEFARLPPTFEITEEHNGSWVQSGNAINFRLVDFSASQFDANHKVTHPTTIYDGSILGQKLKGSAKPEWYSEMKWSAVEVKEPKERSDGPPILLLAVQPPYPFEETMDNDFSGPVSVTAQLEISESGNVAKVNVKKATAKPFAKSVVRALSEWKFLPRIKSGAAVAGSVETTIQFAMH